jgi:hypothetical protein
MALATSPVGILPRKPYNTRFPTYDTRYAEKKDIQISGATYRIHTFLIFRDGVEQGWVYDVEPPEKGLLFSLAHYPSRDKAFDAAKKRIEED